MKDGDGKSQKQNRNEGRKLWSWTSCSSARKTMLHESVCTDSLAAMSVSVNINLWGLNEPVRQAVGLYQIRSASHIYISIPISIAHLFQFQYLHSVYSTSFRGCSASFSTTCPIPLYSIPFSFFISQLKQFLETWIPCIPASPHLHSCDCNTTAESNSFSISPNK